ncbi:MAG: hypothetical protein P4L46_25235 [Fimbriimonas sp.]|nr:hypothetical protein [Fimbriimonas sp.]
MTNSLLAAGALLLGFAIFDHASSQPSARGPKQWDWVGIIGTGQSLSVGARAWPALSTSQPFGNLRLYTGDLAFPILADDPKLKMVPLVEPAGRQAPNYPSSWPENIDGETPHTAAANEISALAVQRKLPPIVTVHSVVGEDGQGIVYLKKGAIHHGINGRSFEGAMIETTAITRLAKAAGKTYGIGAIFVTHGESDCGNPKYGEELMQLALDYDRDIKLITGQTRDVLMIASQQNSVMDDAPSTTTQWELGVRYADRFVCSGPKYQYPYVADAVHLTAVGYQELGEKYGQVFFERSILGRPWKPLEPVAIRRLGKSIQVEFHVPVGKLQWAGEMGTPHAQIAEWAAGKGFELRDKVGAKLAIASVEIARNGRSVTIEGASEVPEGAVLSYAMIADSASRQTPNPGTKRWGLLRDSDPFVGYTTHIPQPNYCVAFKLPIDPQPAKG